MTKFLVRTTLEKEVAFETDIEANNWSIQEAAKHPELGEYIGCVVLDESGDPILFDEVGSE